MYTVLEPIRISTQLDSLNFALPHPGKLIFKLPQGLTKVKVTHNFDRFRVIKMKLICEKYKEEMTQKEAVCRHPNEYCKFRSSCLIHFMSRENAKEAQENGACQKENNHNEEQAQ